jgi:hypothetical protein
MLNLISASIISTSCAAKVSGAIVNQTRTPLRPMLLSAKCAVVQTGFQAGHTRGYIIHASARKLLRTVAETSKYESA